MENKNLFNWAAIVLMLVLAVSSLWYVSTYNESIQPGSFRSFSVTGEGKAIVVPDVARFTFGVLTEASGKDIAKLQTDNTAKMNKIIAVLKKAGLAEKDIKTESYNLSPRYQYCGRESVICPPSQIVGYTIDQTVSVKVRDFGKIGSILSEVVTAGATNISQVEFTVDDMEQVRNEARALAIEQAREQAKATAKAGGFRVGKLLSLEENSGPMPMMYEKSIGFGGDMAVASAPVPAIEPGSTEVVVNVFLRYEIN